LIGYPDEPAILLAMPKSHWNPHCKVGGIEELLKKAGITHQQALAELSPQGFGASGRPMQ